MAKHVIRLGETNEVSRMRAANRLTMRRNIRRSANQVSGKVDSAGLESSVVLRFIIGGVKILDFATRESVRRI